MAAANAGTPPGRLRSAGRPKAPAARPQCTGPPQYRRRPNAGAAGTTGKAEGPQPPPQPPPPRGRQEGRSAAPAEEERIQQDVGPLQRRNHAPQACRKRADGSICTFPAPLQRKPPQRVHKKLPAGRPCSSTNPCSAAGSDFGIVDDGTRDRGRSTRGDRGTCGSDVRAPVRNPAGGDPGPSA